MGEARGPLLGLMREGCGHRYVTMGASSLPRRFGLSHVTAAFLLRSQLQRAGFWSAGAGWKNPLMGGKALSRVNFHAGRQAVGLVLSRSEIVPGFLPS